MSRVGSVAPYHYDRCAVTAERDRFPILVHVVVRRGSAILLLRRARTGYLDGWYALPGGHLARGESVRDCAARELREETGLVVDAEALLPLVALPYRAGDEQGINLLFECSSFAGEPVLAEPQLFDDLRWCAPDALPARTVPYLADALRMAASGEWFREFG